MAKKTMYCLLASLLIFSCAQVKKVQMPETLPSAIPALRILNDTTASAIKISKLDVDISVAANIATTTFDITFFNPNDRILEGEFEFPLADGQNIVRYALDIEGKLREGVVVEKAKARIAFESTIRRKVDPGLVEKTRGNNFRTRIYPLPAKGSRHILIAIEQPLAQLDKNLLYQLPLYAAEPIEHFSIKAAVIKSAEKPVPGENSLANFDFNKKETGWLASLNKNNFIANQTVAFSIPYSAGNETTTVAENYNGQTYFYVHNRMENEFRKKKMPGAIGLLWDISASGEKRDIEKEKKLLRRYLAEAENIRVSLIPFNIDVQNKEDFEINGGDCDALLKRIDQFRYDGGTQFGAIDLGQYNFDEVLLFSDGLSCFGKKEMPFSQIPVTTISSSSSADYSYLKFIAQRSHGQFIDLSKQEIPAATDQLLNLSLQVINIEFDPAKVEDIAIPFSPIQSTGLSFAGKLKAPSAEIKIILGYGDEPVTTKTFTITKPESSECDQVKRIWATSQIAALDLQFEKNKDAITKLGKEFSVVTQNTSLIVLDRVEDYVEHGIVPPADLQKQYYTLLKDKQENEKNQKNMALEQAVASMSELKDWWSKDQPKRKKLNTAEEVPLPPSSPTEVTISTTNINGVTDSVVIANGLGSVHYSTPAITSDAAADYKTLEVNKVELQSFMASTDGDGRAGKKDEETATAVAGIELKEWQPDVPYLKELEKVDAGKREATYFLLKKEYASQPSFFIDVARFFIAKQDIKTGIRILSNVAEMKLENAELLRSLANELLEANQKELAVETFRELVKMREEDPQSYRDLALALNETGNYNEAIQLLYKVATSSWDGRFGEVRIIVLNEMNAIISAHKNEVNIAGINTDLIYAMPVDVRIVIGWSSDNSDVDLWVTDPGKEKCFYENPETRIGGKISQDVTQGFGPEEFLLKKARNGKYKIEVNLYGDSRQTAGGPISIKAELFTDFGKPTQKRETINFRVTSNKEVVELGSLKFGS
ncbi:MAG TPA: VIT domain-containing protein [Chitinophagaceae bacterium]|jgi:tetratricopeptide (TPR) repeat protein|nr:VIT domain-containing protein [Chitinophagaceae bacterium]